MEEMGKGWILSVERRGREEGEKEEEGLWCRDEWMQGRRSGSKRWSV